MFIFLRQGKEIGLSAGLLGQSCAISFHNNALQWHHIGRMPNDSWKGDSVLRNGKSDYMSEWKYVGLGGEIVESSRSICSFCFYLSGGNWRNTLWHLSTICWPAPWLKNLHLDSVARGTGWNDVQHVWKQWVFADWANGSNHENAQITETLNKRAVITADLVNVDHKSLVDVPTPPPKTQPSYY